MFDCGPEFNVLFEQKIFGERIGWLYSRYSLLCCGECARYAALAPLFGLIPIPFRRLDGVMPWNRDDRGGCSARSLTKIFVVFTSDGW